MKFATQISPLLNFYTFIIELTSLVNLIELVTSIYYGSKKTNAYDIRMLDTKFRIIHLKSTITNKHNKINTNK